MIDNVINGELEYLYSKLIEYRGEGIIEMAWAIPPSLRRYKEDRFFVMHGHCDHIRVLEEPHSSRQWRNRLPGLYILSYFYGQIWNEAANRVNGWDRKAANQRTEIFQAELNLWDQFNYFYAGLADESHEPQIKALGKYLKEQKILTIRIFKGIGGLGDPDKDGIIYPEWELLENRESVSYQQNGFEFCAAASITKIKTFETTTVAASVGTLASPQCPNCLTPPPTPPRPDQTGSEWAGWEKMRE